MKKHPSIFAAELETEHFRFSAYCATASGARSNLLVGLAVHARQNNLPLNWSDDYEDGINVNEIEIGQAYRDGEKLA